MRITSIFLIFLFSTISIFAVDNSFDRKKFVEEACRSIRNGNNERCQALCEWLQILKSDDELLSEEESYQMLLSALELKDKEMSSVMVATVIVHADAKAGLEIRENFLKSKKNCTLMNEQLVNGEREEVVASFCGKPGFLTRKAIHQELIFSTVVLKKVEELYLQRHNNDR